MKTKGKIAADKYREIQFAEFSAERNRKAYMEAKKKRDNSPEAIRDKKARETIQPLYPLEKNLEAAIKTESLDLIEKASNELLLALIIAAKRTCFLIQEDLDNLISTTGSANFKDVINIFAYYKHNIGRIKSLCEKVGNKSAYNTINNKFLELKNKYSKEATV